MEPNLPSPYEKLSKWFLFDCFMSEGELKPNYKGIMDEVGTTTKPNRKNTSVLED